MLHHIFSRNVASILLVGSLAMLCGCQSTPPTHPADAALLASVRDDMNRNHPGTVVGIVTAVERRGLPFAAVGDVPLSEFHERDAVTFIDSNRKTINAGIVRRITEAEVHIEWNVPPLVRVPLVGDMVVHPRQEPREMPMNQPSVMPAAAPMTPPPTPATMPAAPVTLPATAPNADAPGQANPTPAGS